MALYYVSDLHLRDGIEPKARQFACFLGRVPRAGDVVVLGGDIFDLFIGDKAFFRARFAAVLDAISALRERGVKTMVLEGNHDFHLRRVFPHSEWLETKPDQFELAWEGRRIWVCHGDEINRRDYGYLLLRFLTRAFWFRALLALVPGAWIATLGEWSSGKSRQYSDTTRRNAARIAATRSLFRGFAEAKAGSGYDLVLIGHSHLEDVAEFGAGRRYVNLGFADDGVPYLRLEPGSAAAQPRLWRDLQ